ncbi:MAG TPA: hypothetical protein VE422_43760 [Terriglobia bacterium]|nr:hypothetical protein [Terriglobia bacterium]
MGRKHEITNHRRTGTGTTLYDEKWTKQTDPAGKVRHQRRDALGRLLQVVEDPSTLNYSTTYTYDPLDNLVGVTQGSQTRSFTYSSLSRLLSATNPETNNEATTYTYEDSGDLSTRTDPRSIQTSFTYDGLHRVTHKDYSDSTSDVIYAYYEVGSASSPDIGQLKTIRSEIAGVPYGSDGTNAGRLRRSGTVPVREPGDLGK